MLHAKPLRCAASAKPFSMIALWFLRSIHVQEMLQEKCFCKLVTRDSMAGCLPFGTDEHKRKRRSSMLQDRQNNRAAAQSDVFLHAPCHHTAKRFNSSNRPRSTPQDHAQTTHLRSASRPSFLPRHELGRAHRGRPRCRRRRVDHRPGSSVEREEYFRSTYLGSHPLPGRAPLPKLLLRR